MRRLKPKRVVALAGMPGAGKTLASNVARKMGWRVFTSGDIIREEARRRNIPQTLENLTRLMVQIRRKEGPEAVARRLIPRIARTSSEYLIYEGPRNIEEINALRRHYDVVTVAIHSAPETRIARLLSRKRSDRPTKPRDVQLRDTRELKVGIGTVISLAEHVIVNEGSRADLQRAAARLFKNLKKTTHN